MAMEETNQLCMLQTELGIFSHVLGISIQRGRKLKLNGDDLKLD